MTYRLDLWSCWAKLYRADVHLAALKSHLGLDYWAEAPIFRDPENLVRIVAKLDPRTGEHVVRVASLPEKALARLAMEVGDAVHNLRTSLDHLAWQLALEHYGGTKPPKPSDIYFPVANTAPDFLRHRALAHFDAQRVKVIGRFQPYSGPAGRLIGAIHDMDVRDKHRLLLGFRLQPSEFRPIRVRTISVQALRPRGGIRVGTVFMRVRFDPTDQNFRDEMESDLTPFVALPQRRGHPVAFLARAATAVGQTLDAFA